MNAKVGEGDVPGIVGKYGLGERNKAGERLIEFCAGNNLNISNTNFQQHKRRLYTWISPNKQYRNQIDYIMCSSRWKSAIQVAKTLPGADCGTDHQLLISKIRLRLKNVPKSKASVRYNVQEIPVVYGVQISNRFAALSEMDMDREPNELWEEVRDIVKEEARNHIPKLKRARKAKWLSEEAINIAKDRRRAKAKGDSEEVRRLNGKFQREARKDKERYLNQECQQIEENSQ